MERSGGLRMRDHDPEGDCTSSGIVSGKGSWVPGSNQKAKGRDLRRASSKIEMRFVLGRE